MRRLSLRQLSHVRLRLLAGVRTAARAEGATEAKCARRNAAFREAWNGDLEEEGDDAEEPAEAASSSGGAAMEKIAEECWEQVVVLREPMADNAVAWERMRTDFDAQVASPRAARADRIDQLAEAAAAT